VSIMACMGSVSGSLLRKVGTISSLTLFSRSIMVPRSFFLCWGGHSMWCDGVPLRDHFPSVIVFAADRDARVSDYLEHNSSSAVCFGRLKWLEA